MTILSEPILDLRQYCWKSKPTFLLKTIKKIDGVYDAADMEWSHCSHEATRRFDARLENLSDRAQAE